MLWGVARRGGAVRGGVPGGPGQMTLWGRSWAVQTPLPTLQIWDPTKVFNPSIVTRG